MVHFLVLVKGNSLTTSPAGHQDCFALLLYLRSYAYRHLLKDRAGLDTVFRYFMQVNVDSFIYACGSLSDYQVPTHVNNKAVKGLFLIIIVLFSGLLWLGLLVALHLSRMVITRFSFCFINIVH